MKATGHDAQTSLGTTEAAPVPLTPGGQQDSRDAGHKNSGKLTPNDKYSEEHEQAMNTLSALWPPEVPLDRAFLESVLDTQCQGNLEVPLPCLLSHQVPGVPSEGELEGPVLAKPLSIALSASLLTHASQ